MGRLILTGIGIAIGVALWPLVLPCLVIAWLFVLFTHCSDSHHDKPATTTRTPSDEDRH